MAAAVANITSAAENAVRDGFNILILSNKPWVDENRYLH
jgi:hypothetical protein